MAIKRTSGNIRAVAQVRFESPLNGQELDELDRLLRMQRMPISEILESRRLEATAVLTSAGIPLSKSERSISGMEPQRHTEAWYAAEVLEGVVRASRALESADVEEVFYEAYMLSRNFNQAILLSYEERIERHKKAAKASHATNTRFKGLAVSMAQECWQKEDVPICHLAIRIYQQLKPPVKINTVKRWIRDYAPSHLRNPGRPRSQK